MPSLAQIIRLALSPEPNAEQKFQSMLEPLGKNGYWKPPHNVAVNFALFGTNLWYFTILPLFWTKKSYREDLGGIVIHPIWISYKGGELGYNSLTEKNIQQLMGIIQKAPSIHDAVKGELHQIEQHFHIEVPQTLKAKIISESDKVAKRRWGVDRMKVRDTLVPLDGGKPRNLGTFE